MLAFHSRSTIFAVAAVAAAIVNALAATPVRAQGSVSEFVACGGGGTLVGVVQALQGAGTNAVAPAALAGEDYIVRSVAGGVMLTGSSSRRTSSIKTIASDSRKTCLYFPSGTRTLNVDAGGTLPGPNVAALSAVLAYRQQHPWPLGAAHADAADTTVLLQTRNGRAFVTIIDFKTQATGGGCGGEEYYRVDLPDFTVRPYDACLEGHRHPAELPYSTQLPG